MSGLEDVRVLRRSPGRMRLHASELTAGGGAAMEAIAAARGVRDVRPSPRTGNVLIEFDPDLVDEPELLALVARESARAGRDPSARADRDRDGRRASNETRAPAQDDWLRAERSETIHAPPAECVAALLEFERYPQWQIYVSAVSVQERDRRGRGVRVRTRAMVAERELDFTTRYRFPSPNRVLFEQEDGELALARGSWAFRRGPGGRTRATLVLELKPGWRLSLLLRGPLYEQIRDAVLDHLMSELRVYVEGGAARRPGPAAAPASPAPPAERTSSPPRRSVRPADRFRS